MVYQPVSGTSKLIILKKHNTLHDNLSVYFNLSFISAQSVLVIYIFLHVLAFLFRLMFSIFSTACF